MNEQQYYKWKADTAGALIDSGVYDDVEAGIIVDWFDHISGGTERGWFGDELLDALSNHWSNSPFEDFVYKTLTVRAWLYADKILEKHNEQY